MEKWQLFGNQSAAEAHWISELVRQRELPNDWAEGLVKGLKQWYISYLWKTHFACDQHYQKCLASMLWGVGQTGDFDSMVLREG